MDNKYYGEGTRIVMVGKYRHFNCFLTQVSSNKFMCIEESYNRMSDLIIEGFKYHHGLTAKQILGFEEHSDSKVLSIDGQRIENLIQKESDYEVGDLLIFTNMADENHWIEGVLMFDIDQYAILITSSNDLKYRKGSRFRSFKSKITINGNLVIEAHPFKVVKK